jgi:hypothetical protein
MRPAALFFDIDQTPFKVHILEIDVSDRRSAHSGSNQSIEDGPLDLKAVSDRHKLYLRYGVD